MARNRRVLVLNHFAAPRGEAGGTRHVELFSRLEGWDHLIIASNLNPQTGRKVGDSDGFVTVPVMGYSSNGISRILNWVSYAAMATLRGLRVRRVDVVYGSSPHLLAALAAWVLSVVKRAPFVLEVRDLWPKVLVDMNHMSESSPIYRALTMLEEFLYAQATSIVIMAEGSRAELVARGIDPDKIVYIPNGADPEDFIPSASRDELRRKYAFNTTTAVYAGAHGPANGLNLLLDGAEECPAVDVVLVGGGVLKETLRADAVSRGLSNVRFLDPVPKDEIPDLLAAADIGVHVLADVELFRSAVSPNKVFDYMASGLPTLTNCPGLVSNLITDTGSGIATDPDQIARALDQFAQCDSKELERMGQAGQAWIASTQSRTQMAIRLGQTLAHSLQSRAQHQGTS
ncbi:glycosyltransferase family 4 protein [Janibacter indicus]